MNSVMSYLRFELGDTVIREQQITIDDQIAGILTYPEKYTDSSDTEFPAVLMLHGFGTNKNEVNEFYRDIAQQLAAYGIVCLRIDFRGYGESTGNAEDFSINDMVFDAIKAFNHLLSLPVDRKKLGVIGFSLGAAIALMLSKKTTFQSLALLSPAVNLFEDFRGFLGAETMQRLAECERFIGVDLSWRKINIGKSFYESLQSCNPLDAAAKFGGDLLCIAGQNDFSARNASLIDSASPSTQKTKEIIPNADHVFGMTGLPVVAKKTADWMSCFLKRKSVNNDDDDALSYRQ